MRGGRQETIPIAATARREAGEAGGADVVRRVLEAFNRRDADTILQFAHPDARFVSITGRFTRAGKPYVGPGGLLEYLADVERLWQGLRVEVGQVQAAGDAVVVIGWVTAAAEAGELRLPVIWTWKFREGLVAECVVHSDERAARKALGIADD